MKLAVAGLWHLGTTTAACMAGVPGVPGIPGAGVEVVGYDPDPAVVAGLNAAKPPVFEPGMEDLLRAGLASGRLTFSADPRAVSSAKVLWITFDTPIDDQDRADVDFVVKHTEALLPLLPEGALVIVSSQLPVGTIRRLERSLSEGRLGRRISFACLPENLRLGKAIETFTKPDRVVAGVRSQADRQRIAALLAGITERIEWMSVESAEMTKHALNAFLATSITFINEIAAICEQVGADAGEVERGLKSEIRIGPRAYLKPGAAFAGGTLARDLAFLTAEAAEHHLPIHLLPAVRASNAEHAHWAQRRLKELLGDLRGKRIAVLGLTYKAETDTLRHSPSLATIQWAAEQGAAVTAFDPAIKTLPEALAGQARLAGSLREAVAGADAIWVATPWPQFKELSADMVDSSNSGGTSGGTQPVYVLDPARWVEGAIGGQAKWRHVTVGSMR